MAVLPTFTDDPALGDIKIVASDMDFTLLDDAGHMPEAIHDRIRALEAAGKIFCAASGRPHHTLVQMFERDLEHMAIIADNGAIVSVRGHVIYTSEIPREHWMRIARFSLEQGHPPFLCGVERAYTVEESRRYGDFASTFMKRIDYLPALDEVSAPIVKFSALVPKANGKEVFDRAYGPAFGAEASVTVGGTKWIDYMNRGVDKGSGLSTLCAHLGVDARDACAIGDNYNDIEMFEAAGHSYLVSNAGLHMMPYADYRAPSNNEAGVVQVIDAILSR